MNELLKKGRVFIIEIVVNFPRKLSNNKKDINFLPNLWHSLKNRKDTLIILDLKSTTYIASNLCSALGLILEKIKSRNNKIYFRNIPNYLRQILINNEFLSSLEFQKSQWNRYNFLAYKKFKVEQKEKFEEYLEE